MAVESILEVFMDLLIISFQLVPSCIICICVHALSFPYSLHRGSYMRAHVLLSLLRGKSDKMPGLLSILSFFRNKFNKFNNTGAQMLYSIYYMTLKLL